MGANSTQIGNNDKHSITIKKCRICGNKNLSGYLDFGDMPLVNNLCNTQQCAMEMPKYPLKALFCEQCGLSQLSEVVDPRLLYSYYTYKSSGSVTYLTHCREMAKKCHEKYNLGLGSADFMVDIGGNDGSLLLEFKKEIKNLRVLNIDPSQNITSIARANGIPSNTEFFGVNSALNILTSNGVAQVITATNVFAHQENLRTFLLSAKIILAHNGVLIIEFPYVVETVNKNSFGQYYHEHLNYLSVKPLVKLAEECDMKVTDCELFEIHDGTLRISFCHNYSNREINENVATFLKKEEELGFHSFEKYKNWNEKVFNNVKELQQAVELLHYNGHKIACFGAAAKGNTLLNACKFTFREIEYIIDQTPEKIGQFSPGTGIPIVDISILETNPPEYLIILAYNFKEEILKKLKPLYGGKIVIPVPTIEII